MEKLNINLENCYGIKKLEYSFDFANKNTFAIYAPNGMMKSSFAKTLKDLAEKRDSCDLVFTDRKTVRNIKDENSVDITPQEVFVVEPYNEFFSSDKLLTLVASQELKEEYEAIYKDIEQEKNNFIKKLKDISKSTDCESEILETFSSNENDNLFDILIRLNPELDGKKRKYDFRYNDVFDKKGKVKNFLSKHISSLDSYVDNYNKLLSKSNLFKKSEHTFGTYQAGEVLKSVSDNSFFEAGHSIELADKKKILSAIEFKDLFEGEINKIVNDENLKKIFDQVDKAIGSNEELRKFQEAIREDNSLLLELRDYEDFRKKVWFGYLDELRDDLKILLEMYSDRKARIEEIIEKSKKEKTEWEKAVDIFNERFINLPFKVGIKNKEDVLLKTTAPSIEFVFHDNEDEKKIERDELLAVLSRGEKRSLYILNIIFEIQARKKIQQKTLLIIDDIADSFDYKFKYAIVEYLKDIFEDANFKQIILTHNFDFFRTLESRFVPYSNCLMVEKTAEGIKIIASQYIKDPLKYWLNNLNDDEKLVSSIPFVRNLLQYTRGDNDSDFLKLTSLLHIKSNTDSITKQELQDIYNNIFPNLQLVLDNSSEKIINLIFSLADDCLTATEGVNFENKIILSIAIRLKAEQFILDKVSDKSEANGNQTRIFIDRFKKEFAGQQDDNIRLLEQVSLMTPENIHLNSFMYEPILDMSDEHLRELYKNIKNLK